VRHRQTEALGLLACQRDQLGKLLSREGRRRSAAVRVRQNLEDDGLQLVVGHIGRLGGGELVGSLCPASAPTADTLRVDTQGRGLLDTPLALRGSEHDLDPLYEPAFECTGPRQPLKDETLAWRQTDRGGILHGPAY
jgi:hypothetical protein